MYRRTYLHTDSYWDWRENKTEKLKYKVSFGCRHIVPPNRDGHDTACQACHDASIESVSDKTIKGKKNVYLRLVEQTYIAFILIDYRERKTQIRRVSHRLVDTLVCKFSGEPIVASDSKFIQLFSITVRLCIFVQESKWDLNACSRHHGRISSRAWATFKRSIEAQAILRKLLSIESPTLLSLQKNRRYLKCTNNE